MDLPLHPMMVHLPLGLVVVLPVVTAIFFILYRMQFLNKASYVLILVLHSFLLGGAYIAEETGEEDEDLVEQVVAEHYIEDHEEKAEAFVAAVTVSFVLHLVFFFLPMGAAFHAGLVLALVMQAGLIYFAYEVGHAGAVLVYEHGAAEAHRQ